MLALAQLYILGENCKAKRHTDELIHGPTNHMLESANLDKNAQRERDMDVVKLQSLYMVAKHTRPYDHPHLFSSIVMHWSKFIHYFSSMLINCFLSDS